MKMTKNKCMIFITALIIVISSMLPMLMAAVEDIIADDNICYEEIKTVQLFKELNDFQRMYLLEHGVTASISEERTSLKREQMQEVVVNILCDYYARGYILSPISDFSIVECEPVLYYSNTESNLSGIFWKIQMELWDELGQSIYLCVDDQTGKALLVSYDCLEPVYDKDSWYFMIETIYFIYQSRMDWYSINGDYREETEKRKEKNVIHYSIGDVLYGEIGMDFIISENGFKIGLD